MIKGLDRFKTKEEAVLFLVERRGCANRAAAKTYLKNNVPKESFYQEKIIEFLKREYPEAFVWKAAAGAYSIQGIPDVCAVIEGRYFGFEIKRPYFGELSAIQERTIERIRAAGGCAGVVIFPEDVQKMIVEEQERWKMRY